MKIRFPIALLIVVVLAAAVGFGLSQLSGSTPKPRHVVHRLAVRPKPGLPKGTSYVAVAKNASLQVFEGRHLHHQRMVLTKTAVSAGQQMSLLVKKIQGEAVQIYLPVRPNGSTGWVSRNSIKLVTTDLALTVKLRSHRLLVVRGGRTMRTIPIGVGTGVTPTPTGQYYITELLKQPNPAGVYGPYAYGLSAYSDVLQSFGGANGQVGIHGTDQPQLVGTDVSHGCIRLRNADITWLTRRLPLGTPVAINRE